MQDLSAKASRFCLNTSTIRECGLGLAEEIRVAGEAGYGGVELWVSEIEAYRQKGGTPAELKRMLGDYGLVVPNLIAFFQWAHPDEAERRKQLDEARRILSMARELGCPYVAAPPVGITDRPDIPLADLAARFGALRAVGRETGVEPVLEFWGHSQILHSMQEALEILAQIAEPGACLLADVFHMAKGGSGFDVLSRLNGATLGLFHINDYPASPDVTQLTDKERVYPGDGVAPWRQIAGALQAIGYRGMLSLELFNKNYQTQGAETVARTGLTKMQAALAGASVDT
ncbi:MAG: sugar phosphate isomerase/epimerase [Kiritimatiellae bacterium]|nr:sugar phosphate isomerase/epimerase [Kiritimatiellia bacterium]